MLKVMRPVIRGALKTIQKHLPWIVVEFNNIHQNYICRRLDCKRDLEKLNYKIADISLGDDDPSCRDIFLMKNLKILILIYDSSYP